MRLELTPDGAVRVVVAKTDRAGHVVEPEMFNPATGCLEQGQVVSEEEFKRAVSELNEEFKRAEVRGR